MPALDGPRQRAARWIESPPVQRLIIGLILINAVILGLETSARMMALAGAYLGSADRVILGVFVAEIAIKLYARRVEFFRNPWNVFDFLVVGVALVPSSGPLAVLRVLRLLRLISMVPKLRFVVEALLRAIPGITSILGLLLLTFYVFAIIASGLFGETSPQRFGHLGSSMYSLFQVMTLESWSEAIVRPLMQTHPWAWAFFVTFILIATFTVLNLFIAVIVNTMQTMDQAREALGPQAASAAAEAAPAAGSEGDGGVAAEVAALREELRLLRESLQARD